MSTMSEIVEIDKITQQFLDQWPALQLNLLNHSPSTFTHGDMGWGLVLQGCYSKIMTRSSQCHIKVKSGQVGENVLFLVFLLQFCSLEMVIKSHLDISNGPYKNNPRGHKGNIRVTWGNTPSDYPYLTPDWNDRNGPNYTMIVIFGPVDSTSITSNDSQPKYTWWYGLGFTGVYPIVMARSFQDHSKDKSGQNGSK